MEGRAESFFSAAPLPQQPPLFGIRHADHRTAMYLVVGYALGSAHEARVLRCDRCPSSKEDTKTYA